MMLTHSERTIVWTKMQRDMFAKHYERAVADGEDTFVFGHNVVLTAYAKHLLDFLDTKFGPRARRGRKVKEQV